MGTVVPAVTVADVARCAVAIFPFIRRFLKPNPVAAVVCTEASLNVKVVALTVVALTVVALTVVIVPVVAANVVNAPVLGAVLPIGGGEASEVIKDR